MATALYAQSDLEPMIAEEIESVTLITVIHDQMGIVVAADGMAYQQHGKDYISYSQQKIKRIHGTSWIFASAGHAGTVGIYDALEAKISQGLLNLNADIRLGGHQYLEEFRSLWTTPQPDTTVLVAGFTPDGDSYVRSWAPLSQKPISLPPIAALGAQQAAATWILRTLQYSNDLESRKRLAYFAIKQIAQQDIRIGSPERHRIGVCSIVPKHEPEFALDPELEQLAKFAEGAEKRLRSAFLG